MCERERESVYVCMCACVCERESEIERAKERLTPPVASDLPRLPSRFAALGQVFFSDPLCNLTTNPYRTMDS